MNPDETRRPGSVTLAVILLILGALTAAVAATSDPRSQTPTALLFLACVWFAVRAGRGRRTARTTVTCLTALILLFATPSALGDPLYGGTALLLAALLAVPGTVLLYRPTAEAYVRARGDRRGAGRPTTEK